MPEYTCDWFSQNEQAFIQVLSRFKGQPGIQALEIGCYEGKATLWLLDNILTGPGSWISCIDTFDGSQEHSALGLSFGTAYERFMENVPIRKRTLYLCSSRRALMKEFTDDAFHFIYVDGSHMAEDVLQDLVLSWPLLKKNGVLIMDDYLWPGVDNMELHRPKIAIDAFMTVYQEHFRTLYSGYCVALEKI